MLKKGILLLLLVVFVAILFNKYQQPITDSIDTLIIKIQSPKPVKFELSKVSPLRSEFIGLLKNQSYSELDTRIEEIAKRFDAGEINESDFEYTISVLSVVDPSLEPLFFKWIEESPTWISYLVTSLYLDKISWAWRGGSFAHLVPESNFKKFKELQATASNFHNKAFQGNKRDAVWHSKRINFANQRSDQFEVKYIEEALKKFPESKLVYWEAINAQQTRWGGNEYRRQELISELIAIIEGQNFELTSSRHAFEAIDFFKERNYIDAATSMEKAIELNPNHYWYYTSLARYYEGLKRYKESLTLLDTALNNTKKEGTETLLQRARIFSNLKQYDKAESDVLEFLKFHPNHRHANNIVMEIYSVKGDEKGVRETIKRGSYFSEQDPRQWVNLAYYPRYTMNNYKLAEELYLKAFALSNLDVGANYNLVKLYNNQYNCPKLVLHLYNYLKGCMTGVGDTREFCKAVHENWGLSSVNYLKKNKSCPEVDDYDFSSFSKL